MSLRVPGNWLELEESAEIPTKGGLSGLYKCSAEDQVVYVSESYSEKHGRWTASAEGLGSC